GEVLDRVGPFDPEFFMYGEEMEWCYRARRAGWRVVHLPGPAVVHVSGASSRPIAGPMFVENLKGRLRFLRKHRGPLTACGGQALIAISVYLRFAAREAQVGAMRLVGRSPSPALLQRRALFRSAAVGILEGMPLVEFSA